MAKKGESYQKKEGMTKKDIYDKLSVLKTDKGKLGYLKSLEKKTGLMSDSTKKAFYETFGELYEKEGNPVRAAESYKKGKAIKKANKIFIQVGDEALKKGDPERAAGLYKEGGLTSNEAEIKIGEFYEKRGNLVRAAESYKKGKAIKKANKIFIQEGDKALREEKFGYAEELYEKGGDKEKAKKAQEDHLAYEQGPFYILNSAEEFEKSGDKEKAKKARLRLGDELIQGRYKGGGVVEFELGRVKNNYKKAGLNDQESFERMGDKLLEMGYVGMGTKYLEKAGAKERVKRIWKSLGDKALREEKFDDAENMYQHLKLTKETKRIWKSLGDKALKKGEIWLANRAYEKIKNKKGLIKVGDAFLKSGDVLDAIKFYKKVGLDKSNKQKDLEKLAEVYEKAEAYGREAMKIRKKIERLEKKK